MNANIWIKALNTRLLDEPNWVLKAGYLVLLIAASLALAAFLLLRATGSFVGYMVVQTAKNFANADHSEESSPNHTDAEAPYLGSAPEWWGSVEDGYRADGHYYIDDIRVGYED